MESQDMLIEAYEKVFSEVEHVLEGLKPEDLAWQPLPECNSIGWLAWHVPRGQDLAVSFLMKEEQLWISEGWHVKFGRAADPTDSGTGHTLEDIIVFKAPEVKVLVDYHRSVLSRSKKYISTLTGKDLDLVLNLKFLPPLTTVGSFLIMVLADGMHHAGQMGYVRGMRYGIGWQKY